MRLATVASIVSTAIVGTWLLSSQLNGIRTDLRSLGNQIVALQDDHFGKAEAEAAGLRMALENPGLKVPDIRNPGTFFRVPPVPLEIPPR